MQAIAAMGGIAYIIDRNGDFRNSFSDGWDRVLSKHPIPFYYCLGMLQILRSFGYNIERANVLILLINTTMKQCILWVHVMLGSS